MNELFEDLHDAIIDGDGPDAQRLVDAALAAGHTPADILNAAMIPAMDQVGKMYECGDVYLAEMLVAARAMQSAVGLLRPHLREANVQAAGRVVLGTVKGDMHDIGKNLVGMMLEGAGFEVIDLGTDVSPQRFIEAVATHRAQIVGMSALLTTTMVNMKGTIEALRQAGVRDGVKIMVGGAPVNEGFAAQIGADGYTPDASQVAALARSLVAALER